MSESKIPSREEIIQAIRFQAAENEGVPLGKRRFEVATGIAEHWWMGRYWARWNDALAEAGFGPNRWVKEGFDDEKLVRHLAELARELGHYPVISERRMRHTADPSFPDAGVFDRKLGARDAQLRLLMQFALDNPDFAMVWDMCRSLVTGEVSEPKPGRGEPVVNGYVYLVKSGKHHKIGMTNHVGRRTYEIDLQLPEKLEVVHVIPTDDPAGIERYWHQRFASKRTNGEWFLLTGDEIAAFCSRRDYM